MTFISFTKKPIAAAISINAAPIASGTFDFFGSVLFFLKVTVGLFFLSTGGVVIQIFGNKIAGQTPQVSALAEKSTIKY